MGGCFSKDVPGEEFGYLGPTPRVKCPDDLGLWKKELNNKQIRGGSEPVGVAQDSSSAAVMGDVVSGPDSEVDAKRREAEAAGRPTAETNDGSSVPVAVAVASKPTTNPSELNNKDRQPDKGSTLPFAPNPDKSPEALALAQTPGLILCH